jgi:signal transduction histidine kinase
LQAVSGSGLGLALVNSVAEQNGGRLELGRAIEGGLRASIKFAQIPEATVSAPMLD